MHAIVIASIVLFVSIFILYAGIRSLLSFWLAVICFWGEVISEKPPTWKYSFKPGGSGLLFLIVGAAGTLWSVIFLAIKIAALVAVVA